MRFTLFLLGAAVAMSGCGVEPIKMTEFPKRAVRLQFASTLPESLTYYDQGFADFIRDSRNVPLSSLAVNELGVRSFVKALETINIEVTRPNRAVQPSPQEEIDQLVTGLAKRSDVDGLVVFSAGRTSSERFMEGMAVMTKIGLLGIDKFSMVFTMPGIAIYARNSTEPCVRLNPVRRKKIPAIYAKWSSDMVNGPTEAVHRNMQAIVADELPRTIRDGVGQEARRISECLTPVSDRHIRAIP